MARPATQAGLIFVGSHLGYPMDRTPLGGGAMVGLHLARAWAADASLRLAVLGSGSRPPFKDSSCASYVQLGRAEGELSGLSEWAYARFCRNFERETTDWILSRAAEWEPGRTAVVLNDLSEAPDIPSLKRAGYRVTTIWHVDVVDYFSKLYLRGCLDAAGSAGLYEALRRARLSGLLPDVLKLVFEKQRRAVELSDLMVLPSRAMAQTLGRCYGGTFRQSRPVEGRCLVQPWGALGAWRAAEPSRLKRLRDHYGIGPRARVLLTLSRISPEKGIDILLEALLKLERSGRLYEDVVVLVCGEAAFMRGRSYLARVRQAASALKRARVFFPGYLSDEEKPEFFALAQLFVSPSLHESYGLTIVEALRSGLPVLASDHYGVRDILKPAYGVAVAYPDRRRAPQALSAPLEALLGDPGKLAAMGRAAAAAGGAMTFEAAASALTGAVLGLSPRPALA
ncbi:MAG: glycosyltransferase family 4 protein [Elusimicrobia bacterium]|nr:glycosyltransferase family 4 protein [Elusimicrobiota bacterium]MDE2236446.1 glycosyltransferase family 4 protein [Elusimicrobiota bacterium]MDE2426720.1 glycosyltransferase family 4 protein [Elusimicrobiota bacterium]